MSYYASSSYWDERYARDGEAFDWYVTYAGSLRDLVEQHVSRTGSTLVVGCGTSTLSSDLAADGFSKLTSVDFSRTCIQLMSKRHPGLQWLVMDLASLSIPSTSIDAVLDKGTIDTILCGEGGQERAAVVLGHLARVLKPGGVFLCISHAMPDARLPILKVPQFGWSVVVETLQRPEGGALLAGLPAGFVPDDRSGDLPPTYYAYVCKKEF
eukprot:ANDGO_00919.mRNA.1 Methyltransferase-like protein 13